jgi:hypothetical protein
VFECDYVAVSFQKTEDLDLAFLSGAWFDFRGRIFLGFEEGLIWPRLHPFGPADLIVGVCHCLSSDFSDRGVLAGPQVALQIRRRKFPRILL